MSPRVMGGLGPTIHDLVTHNAGVSPGVVIVTDPHKSASFRRFMHA